jgi:hypothetical protein
MTQANELDMEAVAREGLVPVVCRKRGCGRVLGLQSADGNEIRLNTNTRSRAPRGSISLTCECGVSQTWRPSRGKKPIKPSISRESLENP